MSSACLCSFKVQICHTDPRSVCLCDSLNAHVNSMVTDMHLFTKETHTLSNAATGDGAGILVGMPDAFLQNTLLEEQNIRLPALGEHLFLHLVAALCIHLISQRQMSTCEHKIAYPHFLFALTHTFTHTDEYAVGQMYLPQNESLRHKGRMIVEKVVQEVRVSGCRLMFCC